MFRYVDWNGEHYSPGAFIATVKNTDLKRINLLNSTIEKEKCVAYIGKKLNINVFSISEGKKIHEITQQPKQKSCTFQ